MAIAIFLTIIICFTIALGLISLLLGSSPEQPPSTRAGVVLHGVHHVHHQAEATVTECARCGQCCDPVILSFDPQQHAQDRLKEPGLHPQIEYQYRFFLDHWSVIDGPHRSTEGLPVYRVRCDQYDPETRACLAQDSKPLICSQFPWYGRDPRSPAARPVADALPAQCSFNADVRPMLPLTVITH